MGKFKKALRKVTINYAGLTLPFMGYNPTSLMSQQLYPACDKSLVSSCSLMYVNIFVFNMNPSPALSYFNVTCVSSEVILVVINCLDTNTLEYK